MDPADRAKRAGKIKAKFEERRSQGRGDIGPGNYLYYMLARQFADEDIRFADLRPHEVGRDGSRAGQLFMVTSSEVVFVYYAGARMQGNHPSDEPGSLTITFHPRMPIKSLTVSGRDFHRYPDDEYQDGPTAAIDSIEVVGDGWSVKLPGENVRNSDGYLCELRSAFDLT